MPDQKNQLNETISHLAERVSGIAVTLHLFEERMKSLTSSLGRVSALLLLQAGIPIGGMGSFFNAARFLGGTADPRTNRTAFILSQIEKGIPYKGGKGQGQGGPLSDGSLSEIGLAALTKGARQEVQAINGLFTELMQVFQKQLGNLIAEQMGPISGRPRKFVAQNPAVVADTVAAWKASGPNPVAVDLEWATNHKGMKNFLQAGFAKSGEVGQKFDFAPDSTIPLDLKARNKYKQIVSITDDQFDKQLAGQGTVDPKEFFKALADKLDPGKSSLADNPAEFAKFFRSQKLWTYSGEGDAEGLNQLWGRAYKDAGSDSKSPFSYGFDSSNVMDIRNLPGVQEVLKQLAAQGKSASMQEVFNHLYGPAAQEKMTELEKAHGSLGHRNDIDAPGQKKHHLGHLDASVTLLEAGAANSWYEQEQAKLKEREAQKEVKQEKQEAKTATPSRKLSKREEALLKGLEELAAADTMSSTRPGPFGAQIPIEVPVPPELKAQRQRDLDDTRQILKLKADSDHPTHTRLSNLKYLTEQANAEYENRMETLPDGSQRVLKYLISDEEKAKRQGRLKRYRSKLGLDTDVPITDANLVDVVDHPVQVSGSGTVEPDDPRKGYGRTYKRPKGSGFKGVVDEHSWGATWKDVKKRVGAVIGDTTGLGTKNIGSFSSALPQMRAFAIALAQATGMLGMLAKAGAPDAFATLQGMFQIIAAQLGSMMVPALMKATEHLVKFASALEDFRVGPGGTVAEDTMRAYMRGGPMDALLTGVQSADTNLKGEWRSPLKMPDIAWWGNVSPLSMWQSPYHYTQSASAPEGSGLGIKPEEFKKAISLVSVKTTPQYSSLEDTYKKIQLDVLGKGPIEKILERIQEESLLKMLERLESMDGKMSGSPTRPFGSI